MFQIGQLFFAENPLKVFESFNSKLDLRFGFTVKFYSRKYIPLRYTRKTIISNCRLLEKCSYKSMSLMIRMFAHSFTPFTLGSYCSNRCPTEFHAGFTYFVSRAPLVLSRAIFRTRLDHEKTSSFSASLVSMPTSS
jgi:hypothetical protein